MLLSPLFTDVYSHFRVLGAVFFVVLYKRCSQIFTTGYHSAFNYLVNVDR